MIYNEDDMKSWIVYIFKDHVRDNKANQFMRVPVSVDYDSICKLFLYVHKIYTKNFKDDVIIKTISIKHFILVLNEIYSYDLLDRSYKKDMENNNRIKLINADDILNVYRYMPDEEDNMDAFMFKFCRLSGRSIITEYPDKNDINCIPSDFPSEKEIIDAIIKTEALVEDEKNHYYYNYKGNLVSIASCDEKSFNSEIIILVNHSPTFISEYVKNNVNKKNLNNKIIYIVNQLMIKKAISFDEVKAKDVGEILSLCYGYKIVSKEKIDNYNSFELMDYKVLSDSDLDLKKYNKLDNIEENKIQEALNNWIESNK